MGFKIVKKYFYYGEATHARLHRSRKSQHFSRKLRGYAAGENQTHDLPLARNPCTIPPITYFMSIL
jgi:hypothetical protein